MGVKDFMASRDARLVKSRIVREVITAAGVDIEGAFEREAIDVNLGDGAISSIALTFACPWRDELAGLSEQDIVSIADIGQFRFVRAIPPGGDESGWVTLQLGELLE